MIKLINFLKGKKSYIVGALTIIIGLINGDMEMIMAGLAMMTIRGAISKVQ